MTLRELAAKAGLSEPQLSRIERNEAGVSVAAAIRLSEVTGLTVQQLVQTQSNDTASEGRVA